MTGHTNGLTQQDRWQYGRVTCQYDRDTRGPMTGRHVARCDWLVRVPRGPVKGCHVAPHYWFGGFNVKFVMVYM
jgi:hypothetical protein